jgi:hypothetical protein
MSVTSQLQILNDANGHTHGFLIDQGNLWHCQWNPQAQEWQRTQVLPGVSGADQLQALHVPDLWPTTSNGQAGSKPGLVLVYRTGLGATAQLRASLAQWDSQGQLAWSMPVTLNTEAPGQVQTFRLALRPEGAGFSLISQLRPTANPAVDSDLITSAFTIQTSSQGAPQLVQASSGLPLATLETAPQPPSRTPAQVLAAHGSGAVALPGWLPSQLGAAGMAGGSAFSLGAPSLGDPPPSSRPWPAPAPSS